MEIKRENTPQQHRLVEPARLDRCLPIQQEVSTVYYTCTFFLIRRLEVAFSPFFLYCKKRKTLLRLAMCFAGLIVGVCVRERERAGSIAKAVNWAQWVNDVILFQFDDLAPGMGTGTRSFTPSLFC